MSYNKTIVWYLLSVCQHRLGPDHYEASLASAERGISLIQKNSLDSQNDGSGTETKSMSPCDGDDMMEMLRALRDGLQAVILEERERTNHEMPS